MGNANKKSKTENEGENVTIVHHVSLKHKQNTNDEKNDNQTKQIQHETNVIKKEKTKIVQYDVADVFRLDDSKAMLDRLWDNARDLQQFSLSQLTNLRRYKSMDQVVGILTTVINNLDNNRAAFQSTLVALQILHQQNKALFFVPQLWSTGTTILQKIVDVSNTLQHQLNRLLKIEFSNSEVYHVESDIYLVNSAWNPIERALSDLKKTIVECLRWCPPKGTFTELASAVNNPSFSDLTLLAKNGSNIHAHKVLLKFRAPALTRYLEQLQEKPLKDISSIYVELNENVIMVLLKFIYAGIIEKKDASVLSEIEEIAEELPEILELRQLLELQEVGVDHSVTSDLLQALSEDPEFSDVTFVVENQTVKAHKVILCLRCQYFHGLLNSGMQESSQDKITIHEMTHNQLSQVIQFIYSDTLPITDPNDSVDLLMLADRFFLNDLKKLCEACVRVSLEEDDIPVDQILNAYQVAKYHTATELKEWLLANSIAKNFEKIVQSPFYEDLDEECKAEINIWKTQ